MRAIRICPRRSALKLLLLSRKILFRLLMRHVMSFTPFESSGHHVRGKLLSKPVLRITLLAKRSSTCSRHTVGIFRALHL